MSNPHRDLSDLAHSFTDGSDFMGERLVVQFARGPQRPPRDFDHASSRPTPRPRRTVHRMTITGLPVETSWQVSNIPDNIFYLSL